MRVLSQLKKCTAKVDPALTLVQGRDVICLSVAPSPRICRRQSAEFQVLYYKALSFNSSAMV